MGFEDVYQLSLRDDVLGRRDLLLCVQAVRGDRRRGGLHVCVGKILFRTLFKEMLLRVTFSSHVAVFPFLLVLPSTLLLFTLLSVSLSLCISFRCPIRWCSS